MPVIYLLRHGQASFGTDDYDVLSERGRRQADVAGRELLRRGVRSPVMVSGSLRRQIDTGTIAAIVLNVKPPISDSRFDEFDAHAAVNSHLSDSQATEGMSSAQFQQHLDAVMAEWMDNGNEQWQIFSDNAYAALSELAASLPRGSDAVVATSAGVTAVLAGRLLGADTQGVIAMNRVSVNASITSVVAGSRGLSLVSFNDHAHVLSDGDLFTNR
jgi:broad specificity phosphatase PhoE